MCPSNGILCKNGTIEYIQFGGIDDIVFKLDSSSAGIQVNGQSVFSNAFQMFHPLMTALNSRNVVEIHSKSNSPDCETNVSIRFYPSEG